MIVEGSLAAMRLGSDNVFPYLVERGICSPASLLVSVEQLLGKNMNLLVHVSPSDVSDSSPDRYIVKQGPVGRSGVPKDGFDDEWHFSELLQSCDELEVLQPLVSQALAYDRQNEILVCRFFQCYQDLGDFYSDSQLFPPAIAVAMGAALASLHRATYQRTDYLERLDPDRPGCEHVRAPDYRHELGHLTPSIFQRVSIEALEFYELYQRTSDLSGAIAELEKDARSCCLIHGDLKFNNILLHDHWASWAPQRLPAAPLSLRLSDGLGVVRLIDWEQWAWGDPAFDVGALVADYLRAWLRSLILSSGVDLTLALRMAAVPLELIQPSLQALLQAYTAQFPEIVDHHPDFFDRVFQFAGVGLIGMIQAKLHYYEPFDIAERSMLQVAKSLLCQPEAAREMLVGRAADCSSRYDPAAYAGSSGISTHRVSSPPQAQPGAPLPRWTRDFSTERMLADLIQNIRVEPPVIEHAAYMPLNLDPSGHQVPGEVEHGRYRALPEDLQRNYLLEGIKDYVYGIYFSGEQERRGESVQPEEAVLNNAVAGVNLDFLTRLEIANQGTGFVDPGWIVVQANEGQLQIEKEGLHLWVRPAVDLASATDPAVGSKVRLKMPHALFAGDCYVAIGNEGEPLVAKPRIRIYFNISADGALLLLGFLSEALNRQRCRYSFKVLHDPSDYRRHDAASVEVQASSYRVVASALEQHSCSIASYLKDPIPLFSYPLAPGIGLVESPRDGADFGLSRCELLAEALLESQASPHSRLQMMADRFVQHGLDWSRPYLNPGSMARYLPLSWVPAGQVTAAAPPLGGDAA